MTAEGMFIRRMTTRNPLHRWRWEAAGMFGYTATRRGAASAARRAHTVDIGHVHVLTAPGGPCAPTCPHPDHRPEETPDA